MTEILEISDVIVDYNPDTLERCPVHKEAALERLRAGGAGRAAIRIVERLPDVEGTLDPDVVDALLVSAHAELQRLWEEFLIGARVKALLLALVRAIDQDRGGTANDS